MGFAERYAHVLLFGGLLVVAALSYAVLAHLKTDDFRATGTLRAGGGKLARFELGSGVCATRGADGKRFAITYDHEASIVVDLAGADPVVNVEAPSTCVHEGRGCPGLRLTRATCSLLDVVLEPTSSTFNKRRVFHGRVRLDCTLDGGRVEASLAFAQCV